MKKFKGLIIPEHDESDEQSECCSEMILENCHGVHCVDCILWQGNLLTFKNWLELNRPCEICEDEQ